MSAVPVTRTKFLQALSRIAKGRDNADDPTTKLRRALLDFASETPDNLNCAERIEVGTLGAETGLALHGRGVLLSDIAHALENAPMPDALKDALPDISAKDWDAFTRLTTLIYSALTQNSSSDH
jgi:hypothetical protein